MFLLPFSTACITQGGNGELDLETPKVEVTITLDKDAYQIGEPIIATVSVKNTGEELNVLAVPGAGICDFYARREGASPEQIDSVEFLTAPDDIVSMKDVEAGESLERPLLVYRYARKPGKFVMFARYRTDEQSVRNNEVSSGIVHFTIEETTKFDRDREGLLTEAEAIRVGREHFKVTADVPSEALLAKDETRLSVWLVTFHTPGADGKTEDKSAFVSPYTGSLKREANTTVAAERKKKR